MLPYKRGQTKGETAKNTVQHHAAVSPQPKDANCTPTKHMSKLPISQTTKQPNNQTTKQPNNQTPSGARPVSS